MKIFRSALLVGALGLGMAAGAQSAPVISAAGLAGWQNTSFGLGGVSAGNSAVLLTASRLASMAGGWVIPEAFAGLRIYVSDGAASETVTVTAANCASGGIQGRCGFSADFASAHAAPLHLSSGSHGLDGAIEAAIGTGGGVVMASGTGGITAALMTGGSVVAADTAIGLFGSGAPVYYVANAAGTGWAQAASLHAPPVLSGSFAGAAALCPLTTYRATVANTVSLDFAVLAAAACTPASGTYQFLAVR